jgi:hypothetical protein
MKSHLVAKGYLILHVMFVNGEEDCVEGPSQHLFTGKQWQDHRTLLAAVPLFLGYFPLLGCSSQVVSAARCN